MTKAEHVSDIELTKYTAYIEVAQHCGKWVVALWQQIAWKPMARM